MKRSIFRSAPRTRVAVLATVVGIAAYSIALTVLRDEDAGLVVSDVGLSVAAALAGACCFVAARRHEGPSRRAWMLMGAAMVFWTIGESIWSWYELVADVEVPFPSFADLGYLTAIPLAAAAIFSFPSGPPTNLSRVRALLDGFSIAGSIFLLSWAAVLGPLFRSTGESLLGQLIGIAYPAGDVVILTASCYALARCRDSARKILALLALGLSAIAVADSWYTITSLDGSYASGHLIDGLWLGGYLVIGLAATLTRPEVAPSSSTQQFTFLGAAMPYAAVVLASSILVAEKVSDGLVDSVTLIVGLAIVLLVAVRQFLTQLENVRLSRTLEERVQIRTRELGHALDELKETGRLQEEFIAATSHELRTPLTTILGASRLLLRTARSFSSSEGELLAMIDRNGLRMAAMVEELLAVSGIVDGTPAVREKRPFNLSLLLEQITLRFEGASDQILVLGPHPMAVVGDEAGVQVVVENLVSNAIKFGGQGCITIEVSTAAEAIDILVRDEGMGVPWSLRDKIFERFYQVDGSTTREQGGLGLGLFLARRTAETMGATLTLESSERGAAFRLRLPQEARTFGQEQIVSLNA